MILDRHPSTMSGPAWDAHVANRKKGLKYLGYWHSVMIDPVSMMPVKTGHDYARYTATFGEKGLPLPSDWVDTTWDLSERAIVMLYLKGAGKVFEQWRGNSWCRFGCPRLKGSTDLSDGTYVWPEDFVHYVEVHGIKPPDEFIQHVLTKVYKTTPLPTSRTNGSRHLA